MGPRSKETCEVLEGLWLLLLSQLREHGKFWGTEMTCAGLYVEKTHPVSELTLQQHVLKQRPVR